MKPTLLMNVGTSFSASSPLHYTLGWDNKYCHTGHTKEHQYLYITQVGKKAWGKRHAAKKREKRRREEIEQGGFTSKPDVLTGESPLIKNKFSGEVIKRFYKTDNTNPKHTYYSETGGYSVETYIDYYKELWKHVKGEYAAVGDFSNQGFLLSEEFMLSIKDRLLEEFDVKITMIFRDPVRRLFSRTSKTCQHYFDMTPVEYFKHHIEDHLDKNAHYHETYERFVRVWGKDRVHMIVMEELWSDYDKMIDLSEFLNFPLTKVHENVYYPDKGPNAPKYDYLKDQWCSNTVHLDKSTWEFGMEHLDWIYSGFSKTFGYIPKEWGEWYET